MTLSTEAIVAQLDALEVEHDVRILYACESGSRAWGFASADSDFDVRHVYVARPERYRSIAKTRDVIEGPLDATRDFSGWDARKALELFRKSNPSFLEWLGSPIVYRERTSFAAGLRELAKTYYSPIACAHHYEHMARGNFREYLQGEEVWLKQYFYVLRPLLAVRWLERGLGVVPMEFARLVEVTLEPGAVRDALEVLTAAKRTGAELSTGPRVSALNDFIEAEFERRRQAPTVLASGEAPIDQLDDAFRKALGAAWGDAREGERPRAAGGQGSQR
ncbi:MAG: nucleotidyltransferase domain-containing protein [Planctomycetes bacterium]|nr:nucleotidyltransferase domain-containing protein [Planctomycetota bacterium]